MTKPLFPAVLLVLIVSLCARTSTAQPQRPPGPGVAIIDLTYIFKNHTRFQAMKDDLERDVKRAEEDLKALQKQIAELIELRKEYNSGTPDYRRLDEQIVQRQAELQSKVKLQRKDFVRREAKAYYNVYREITDEVGYYAERSGINVVLRFNGEPTDQSAPEDVLKALNKPIIYYNRAIDITPIILERLERRQGAPNPQLGTPPNRQGVPRR